MSKVFMTVVGTSNYNETAYKLGDAEPITNRFVQKSLLTLLKNKGEEFDKIIFFLTNEAKEGNWKRYYRKNKYTGKETIYENEGLEAFLEENFPGKYMAVPISTAENEEGILSLFNNMYDSMTEGDEITLDVTHGFRSISFLFFPVISYAKELKKIKIDHIYYGNYIEDKTPTEIVDLKKYDEILDWSNAAHNFIASGNASEIKELSDKRYNSIDNKKEFSEANTVSKWLLNLTNALLTCKGANEQSESIAVSAKKLIDSSENLKKSPRYKEYVLYHKLIEHAIESVRGFSGVKSHYELGLQAAEWYKNRNLVQQAYTAMRETIISFLCSVFGNEENADNKDFRLDVVTDVLNTYVKEKSKKHDMDKALKNLLYKPVFSENINYKLVCIKMFDMLKKIDCDFIMQLTDTRNKINHFGMNKNTVTISKDNLERHYEDTKKFIEKINAGKNEILTDEQAMKIADQMIPEKTNVFVNFSNHSVVNWSEEQKNAAAEIVSGCKIADVPFPQVNGSADEDEIQRIAEKSIQEILSYNPSAVMCQGEFGVCWKVVSALQKMGIKVVYSCSERKAVEKQTENGVEKTSVFCFARFREFR